MKKILNIIIILITLSPNIDAANVQVQENRREAIFFWQDEKLTLKGAHRPYSTIKIYKNNQLISQTKSDAMGNFEFSLGQKLDPAKEHLIEIRAFDRFDREIRKEDETADIITKKILPGLQAKGKITGENGEIIKNAKIKMFDIDGNLLNQFKSDENGNFIISNAPKNAKLVVEAEEIEEKEIIFNGEKDIQINPKIDKENPYQFNKDEKDIEENKFNYQSSLKPAAEEKDIDTQENLSKSNQNIAFISVALIMVIISIVLFLSLRKKES